MTDYTKKNVSELTDSAPEFGLNEIQEARFGRKEVDAEQIGFGHQLIKAGKRQGFGHVHEEAEEIYFVVSGSGQVRLDDDIVDLAQGDVVRVGPKVKRRFQAGEAADLEVLAFGALHEGDGEIIQDFWAPEDD